MAGRTITDAEIALIQAMVARGMKNRDIQFFFNRPGRAVNSGRITDIASGKYSNSASIKRATDDELNAFLASRSPSIETPVVVRSVDAAQFSPLAKPTLRRMFAKGTDGVWRLAAGETDQAECKANFGFKHPSPWLRAIAALANNRGGYVFFGIADKDPAGAHAVLGLSSAEFENADPADLAKRLRATFDPTPRFQRSVFEIGGKKVGVLFVEQHPSRPIIATRQEGSGDIREGDIFFRYSGQSTRITYADLRAMLDARDAQARSEILPMIQRLLALGPSRAMIADLAEGRLTDGKRMIELDEEFIKQLNLIKQGEFDERLGAPALRLIGEVKATASAPVKKGLVTRAELQRDFLADALNADPLDYLRCATQVSGNDWLPIRYFGRKAGLSHSELLAFIANDPDALPAQKTLYKERLATPDKAYVQAKGPAREMLRRLLGGDVISPKDAAEARVVAMAVQGLGRPLSLESATLREVLAECMNIVARKADALTKTALRKAIARLDELISSP